MKKKKKDKSLNNKMAINTYLSTIEYKNKTNIGEQKKTHRYRKHLTVARWVTKVKELRSTN